MATPTDTNSADPDDAGTVDRVADELYGLDPDEFTATRNARAKELAKSGAKEAAAAVKALAKPTVPAWALNQAARRQPDVVGALLEAGGELRRAQEQALAGDASALRDAGRKEQARIADGVGAASAVLREAGKEPTAAHIERMTATLRAAATDHGAGELLRAGRLSTDLSPAGFGLDELALAAPPRRRAAKEADATPSTGKDEAQAQQEAHERLAREAKEAVAEADEAERVAAAAEAAAAQADADARQAEERARRLAHEARTARSAATKARRQATAAEGRLERSAG